MTTAVNANIDINKYKSDNAYVAAILNEHGITKQTSINEAAGEATYVDYAGGLGEDLKNAVLNGGFGENDGWDDAEIAIRENIASLYKQGAGKSNFQTKDLIAMVEEMGYSVDSTYMKTSYISDNKADGKYDTDVKSGSINVLTITDKDGNNIVIADANGNAAIEVEEVFLNEIITGATSAIQGMNTPNVDVSSFDSQNNLELMTFNVEDVLKYQEEDDIWLKIQKERMEKEAQEAKEEQEAKKAKEEKEAKEAKKEEKEKAIATKQQYKEIKETFEKEYLEELQNDEEYANLSQEEKEKKAEDEAEKYMNENYIKNRSFKHLANQVTKKVKSLFN